MAAARPTLLALVLLGAPFLVLATPAAVAADEPSLYDIPDGTGDVVFGADFGTGQRPTYPGGVASDPIDITSFRIIGEDGEQLTFEIRVLDLGLWWTTHHFGSDINALVMFVWKSSNGDVKYRLSANGFGPSGGGFPQPPPPVPSGPIPADATLCINSNSGDSYSCSWGQRASAAMYVSEDRFTFVVPKLSILAQNKKQTNYDYGEAPKGIPPVLDAGAHFEFTQVKMTLSVTPPAEDVAPNPGTTADPFLLTQPAANTKIKLALVAAPPKKSNYYYEPMSKPDAKNNTTLAVVPGAPFLVPVKVHNNMETKRLVNLTTRFSDPTLGDEWNAEVAPTLEIPARDSRVVNLVLNVSDAVQHRNVEELIISAVSLGYANELAQLNLNLQVTATPSPERPKLFFHVTKVEQATTPSSSGGPQRKWLNTLERDELGTGDEDQLPPSWTRFELDTPLARDLVFSQKESVHVSLLMQSQAPTTVSVKFILNVGDYSLGIGRVEKEVTSTPTNVEAAFVIDPRFERIVAGSGVLSAQLEVHRVDTLGQFGSVTNEVRMLPRGSYFTLPLIPDPKATKLVGPKVLGLSTKGDADDFLNPGRTALYEVVLVNEAGQSDQVALNFTVDRGDWAFRVEPSLRYNLKSGESITFAVLVTAREKAVDGEQLRARVYATSTRDPRAASFVEIRATTVTGTEIPDEGLNYQADPDSMAKAVQPPQKAASGLAAFAVLGALGAVAVLQRRRSERL